MATIKVRNNPKVVEQKEEIIEVPKERKRVPQPYQSSQKKKKKIRPPKKKFSTEKLKKKLKITRTPDTSCIEHIKKYQEKYK